MVLYTVLRIDSKARMFFPLLHILNPLYRTAAATASEVPAATNIPFPMLPLTSLFDDEVGVAVTLTADLVVELPLLEGIGIAVGACADS